MRSSPFSAARAEAIASGPFRAAEAMASRRNAHSLTSASVPLVISASGSPMRVTPASLSDRAQAFD